MRRCICLFHAFPQTFKCAYDFRELVRLRRFSNWLCFDAGHILDRKDGWSPGNPRTYNLCVWGIGSEQIVSFETFFSPGLKERIPFLGNLLSGLGIGEQSPFIDFAKLVLLLAVPLAHYLLDLYSERLGQKCLWPFDVILSIDAWGLLIGYFPHGSPGSTVIDVTLHFLYHEPTFWSLNTWNTHVVSPLSFYLIRECLLYRNAKMDCICRTMMLTFIDIIVRPVLGKTLHWLIVHFILMYDSVAIEAHQH